MRCVFNFICVCIQTGKKPGCFKRCVFMFICACIQTGEKSLHFQEVLKRDSSTLSSLGFTREKKQTGNFRRCAREPIKLCIQEPYSSFRNPVCISINHGGIMSISYQKVWSHPHQGIGLLGKSDYHMAACSTLITITSLLKFLMSKHWSPGKCMHVYVYKHTRPRNLTICV